MCEIFLIMGADQARALHRWRAYPEIIRLATIGIADRNYSAGTGGDRAALQQNQPQRPDEQAAIRQVHLRMPVLPISATDIRAKIAAGQDVNTLITSPVARYIARHHLYTKIQ